MLLLRHGASVHAVNDLLRTPLHLAAFNGHHIAVDMLLKVPSIS
jgi:ankyrin repeat protein